MHSRWRDRARPIIARVIADNPGLPVEELRKLISAEYPFGERAMHPYKIWLDEVRTQLGLKPKPNVKGSQVKSLPGQQGLF